MLSRAERGREHGIKLETLNKGRGPESKAASGKGWVQQLVVPRWKGWRQTDKIASWPSNLAKIVGLRTIKGSIVEVGSQHVGNNI